MSGCLEALDALHEIGLAHSRDGRSLERVRRVYNALQFPSPNKLKVED